MSSRRLEFWRSKVSAAVTARLMPALSLSSETCMKTMPMSATATSAIHARPRTRRSSTRASPTRMARVPRRSASGGRATAARGRRARARVALGRGCGPEIAARRARRGGRAARRARADGGRRWWRAGVMLGSSSSFRAARIRADRARGLAATSPGVGATARRVSSSASGTRPQAHTGRSGGQMQPRALAARKRFTRRSSSEWKEIPANRPRDAQQLPGGGQRRVELAELVVDRDADGLEDALGRMAGGEAGGRRAPRRSRPRRARWSCRSGAVGARADERAGDGPRVALLAVVAQQRRQAALVPRR